MPMPMPIPDHVAPSRARSGASAAVARILCLLMTGACATPTLQRNGPDGGADATAAPESQAVEAVIRGYLDAYAAQDPERVRRLVTEDFVVIENGYPLSLDRAIEGMDPRRPLPMRYRLENLRIEMDGDLAVYRFDLGWFADGEQVDWGLETGHARRIAGEWKLAQNHMTFLPARGHLPVATLRAYEGDYRGLDFQGGEDLIRLYVDDGRLLMTRPDGRPLIGGILRLGMIPDPAGGFFVEVLNGRVEFEGARPGEVSGLTYIPPSGAAPAVSVAAAL